MSKARKSRRAAWSWTLERQDGRIFSGSEATQRRASRAEFDCWFAHELSRVAGVTATMVSHPTRGAWLMLRVYETGMGWVPVRVEDVRAFLRTAGSN
jgi:hypothetical protein